MNFSLAVFFVLRCSWISWVMLLLQPQMVALQDLTKWIPHMRVRRAHSGDMKSLAKDYRVVVLMTTIPHRISRIEPVLDSMLRQTWPVEEIYLSIPFTYNRTGENYVIPDWLNHKQGVKIVRCEDLGPGTHLLNGLRLEKDPWTFLAVVDDDHIYGIDLVETLVRAALAYPGSAVAAQGFLSVPGLLKTPEMESLQASGLPRPRYLHDQGFAAGPVLVSYLGVLYQRGFFDDAVYDYTSASDQCRYQDDMWFSAHLARKGIRRNVLGAALGVEELTDMHLGPESLTKWKENRPRHISDQCNSAMLLHDPNLWAYRRRVVLSLGGLPPPSSDHLEISSEWTSILRSLKRLSRIPDLIYLCTEGWDMQHISDSPARNRSTGYSFYLEGILVTGSNACQPHVEEPRVFQLLKDPLQWEGDANTVIVFGSFKDLQESGSEDLWAVANCAADLYDCNEEDAELDSKSEKYSEQQTLDDDPPGPKQTAKEKDTEASKMISILFSPKSKMRGIGELIDFPWNNDLPSEKTWPFCRIGNFGAVAAGAFLAQQPRA